MNNFLEKQIKKRTKQLLLKEDNNELVKQYIPKSAFIYKIVDLSDSRKNIFRKVVTYYIYTDISYNDLVHGMIREKYSDSEEFGILRESRTNITEKFIEYDNYVEDCIAKAKEFIAKREKDIESLSKEQAEYTID